MIKCIESAKEKRSRGLRRWAATLAACCALSLFAGCRAEERENPEETAKPAVEVGVEQEIVQQGGQIITYVPDATDSLNPLLNGSKEMDHLLSLCYEKLIDYDQTLRFSPSLAESWVKDEEDAAGRTWLISLRKGVRWHDGHLFTSADVLYTLSLLRSPAYAESPYAYHLAEIVDCIALDDHTLRLTATGEGTLALRALTFPVLPAHAYGAGEKPLGTGPYKLTHADEANGLQFDANEAWWRTPPLIQRIHAKRMLDNTAALNSLDQDALNFVPTESLTASGYREQGRINVAELPSMQAEMLLINHRSPVLQSLEIRQAIAYGIDRRDIITKAYLGHAFAADVPVPPHCWLYDSDSKVYDYNLQRAQTLLKEQGWLDLDGDQILEQNTSSGSLRKLRLRLLVNDTPEETKRKDAASIIQASLAQIGIGVEIVTATWNSTENAYASALAAGDFDLALVGFYMDKGMDLSSYLSADGALNYGAYSSGEMESALRAVEDAGDDQSLEQSMRALQHIFIRELPFIQLYYRTSSVLFTDTLTLENASSLSEERPFNGVERWHFDSRGRTLYPVYDLADTAPEWNYFDRVTPEERWRQQHGEDETQTGEGDDEASEE